MSDDKGQSANIDDFTFVKIDFEGESLDSIYYPASAQPQPAGQPKGQPSGQPAVLILPTVMGISDLEKGFARKIGYGAMIADLFGADTRGASREIMFGHMGRLKGDRAALRRRLQALLDSLCAQPGVDSDKVAVIGYCFGGLCALDIARSGADVRGVASFHGLFDPPGLAPQPITAKVLAMHGWDDPIVPPDAVVALGKELTEAGADWQIHAYGHTGHGFTNPSAGRMGIAGVAFDEAAARRSWDSLERFLAELFE